MLDVPGAPNRAGDSPDRQAAVLAELLSTAWPAGSEVRYRASIREQIGADISAGLGRAASGSKCVLVEKAGDGRHCGEFVAQEKDRSICPWQLSPPARASHEIRTRG